MATPVLAQNPQQGDYFAPGPTTPVHLSPGEEMKLKDGDYYAGETMILNKKRTAAVKKIHRREKICG
jgi:hypothetical protein